MRLAIQKMGYSRNPWRLVDLDAPEEWNGPQQVVVSVQFDHPDLGMTQIEEAVSGNTKTECIESVLRLLANIIDAKRREAC